jgi:hypothetical protein
VGTRVLGTAGFVLIVMLSAAAPVFAQSPSAPLAAAPLPSPGFVPPYEIVRTARAAGFDPLAPPLREGATYVLRATDFNGILMRVVVDARTGAIRDANRIVAGPGNYDSGGQFGMAAPDGSAPDMLSEPYRLPPEFDAPVTAPLVVQQSAPPALQPPPKRHVKLAAAPLPRARPAKLAVRKSGDKSGEAPGEAAKSNGTSTNGTSTNSASDRPQSLSSGAEAAAPTAPTAKPGRAPSPAIND